MTLEMKMPNYDVSLDRDQWDTVLQALEVFRDASDDQKQIRAVERIEVSINGDLPRFKRFSKADWKQMENQLYAEQKHIIKRDLGPKVKANFGWGVRADTGEIVVETKVYGHGVLVSTAERHGCIRHEWALELE